MGLFRTAIQSAGLALMAFGPVGAWGKDEDCVDCLQAEQKQAQPLSDVGQAWFTDADKLQAPTKGKEDWKSFQ